MESQSHTIANTLEHIQSMTNMLKQLSFVGEDQRMDQVSLVIQATFILEDLLEKLNISISNQEQDNIISVFNMYLKVLKRFAFQCPIREVAALFYEQFQQFVVSKCLTKNNPLSQVSLVEDEISRFFPVEQAHKIFDTNPQEQQDDLYLSLSQTFDQYDKTTVNLRKTLDKMFFTNGRIYNHQRLLCWFPKLLQLQFKTLDYVMNKESVLPLNWRYYLSIMEELFLQNEGQSEWLQKGMIAVPNKLRRVGYLNEIMAHKPWALNEELIEELTKPQQGGDEWTTNELTRVGIIFACFHSMCGLVLSQGIQEESSLPLNIKKSNSEPLTFLGKQEEKIVGIMKVDDDDSEDSDSKSSHTNDGEIEEVLEDEDECEEQYTKYLSGQIRKYVNFDQKAESWISAFEYYWDQHSFNYLIDVNEKLAMYLTNEFKYAFEMTNESYGDTEVDTRQYRTCIRFYIEKIFGLNHEDFNYSKVNKRLIIPLKNYIKKIACCPHLLTQEDYMVCSEKLNIQEKCHVGIIVMETKKQTSLVYLFKAISSYNSY